MKLIQYIIISTLFLLVSCSEYMDVKLNTGDTYLVVDGELSNQNQEHFIHLSLSAPYFQNVANEPVSNATISLSDGVSEIILEESEEEIGTYIIPKNYATHVGSTYTIVISDVDVNGDNVSESYQASNVMKAVPPIKYIDLQWYEGRGSKLWKVLLYTKDPEESVDFYTFALYLNDEDLSPKISDLEYADDTYFNGNEINGVWAQSVIEEEDEEKKRELQLGDWVKLEMQSINEDYYDFIDAINEETGIKVPLFSGPSANVPTNISNGAVGFFRVYSVVQDSVLVTQDMLDQRDEK